MQCSGHIDYYFLPGNRFKIISSLSDTNGQPIPFYPSKDIEKEGRYYFVDNKLVTWGDKEEKPKPPKDFSLTDAELKISDEEIQLVLRKQAQ
jgi:hypothetical protein